jgi:hypothetical protein
MTMICHSPENYELVEKEPQLLWLLTQLQLLQLKTPISLIVPSLQEMFEIHKPATKSSVTQCSPHYTSLGTHLKENTKHSKKGAKGTHLIVEVPIVSTKC